ncbi:uncharacterized protein LOC143528786 [Brachyhypopomus gauderio]|uniref:uncharacterized protein LOC143528786 n=1 Tax=Brachyhypopomus gauderio TaxID=698409 RepID=UPI004042B982
MPRHQRRFSDSLVLEEDGKGSVLVSRINPDLSASQGLQEGDKIVGATIHFDHLTKYEVAEILKLIEPYDDKVQMLAKQNKGSSKSKSLESLDRIKAPDEMLKDSYSKIFSTKVKKFLKENPDGSQEKATSSLNGQKAAHVLSHDKTKNDISSLLPNDLPMVDFRNKKVDVEACLQKVERREKSLKTLQSVDHFGPLESQNDITVTGTPEVNKNDMKTLPNTSVVLQKGNIDITTNMSDSITRPDLGPHTYNKTPNMNVVETMTDFDSEVNNPSPDVRTNVPVGKFLKTKKSNSKANAHGVSEYEYNFDPLQQSVSLGQRDEVRVPEFDEYNSDLVSGQFMMEQGRVKTPQLDIDTTSKHNYSPEFLLQSLKKTPDIDINSPKGKHKMPNQNLPDFKSPEIDVKGDLQRPNLRMSSPNLDSDEGPNLNVKSPDMDIDGPSGKMKMPNFKIPTFGHPKDKTPETDISAPTFKGDINSPDFNIKGHKTNFTVPELDADIHSGKVKMPTLEKPNYDINSPEFDTYANTGKLKMPKFGLSGNLPKSPDLKGPKFKGGINGKDIDLTLPESDLKIPNLDYNSPDIGIESSGGKLKTPKFKTPKFDMPGFKGPKTEGNLKHPDLSVSSPELDGEISTPDMNIDGPKLKSSKGGLTLPDVNLPSGNLKMPKLKTPNLGLSGPNVKAPEMDFSPGIIKGEINSPDFTGPDVNIDMPTGKIKGSTLKTPNVDMKVPEFDTDVPTGKFKMPKFGFSGNLPNAPNLKGPKIKGGIDTPNMDLNLSKPDFEGPNLNVKSPDMDIDGPSKKMKMPTFKIPTLGHPKVKTPEMDISGPTFKGDINSPDFNIKGHKPNFTAPELDTDIHAGKMKMPTLEKPNFDINAPEFNTGKLKKPKFGLSGNLPKSPDLKGPKFKGGISGQDINLTLPESDFKTPNLEYNSPDIGMEGSVGKFKTPKFKTPKFSFPGFKGHKTDIKGDLKHPDFNLSSPGLDGEISAPDMNIDGPKFKSSKGGLTLPDVNLPSGNVKMPKLKTPNLGLSGPNVKAPEMDLSPGMIKGEINSPDFTGPDVNIDMPTGKIKGSTLKTPNVDMKAPEFDTDVPTGKFKMPKFGFSGNLPKGPDFKGPKIKGGIDTPNMDLNLSKPDFEGPNLNVKSPDMDIDGPSGKMKMPTFKIPTLGHPKVKTPEMDISGPTFKGDINSPDFNIKGHKPNFTAPELDTDIHAGKMKMPTLEKPNFDINAPEFNTGKLKKPKFGLSGNLPKSPDLKGPKFKGGISGKGINMTLPESDLKTPNLDYNSPDIGMEGSGGKFKTPKFKTPKFSFPGFKGPKTDIKGDLKHPDLNLSSPGLDGEISAPDMNIDGPKFKSSKGGLTLPDVNLPSGNVKMPKLKTPNLGLSGPNVKAPEMDLSPGMIKGEINSPDFTGSDVNIDMPTGKIKGSTLKTPNVDMKAPEFDTDVPTGKFKMPKFGFSGNLPKGPDLKGPKIKGGIDNPKMDLNLSKPDFEGPNLNVKSPDMDIDGPSGKMKMPNFKIPTLGRPKVKTPEMDISAPTFKGDINSPEFKMKGHKPNFTVPDLDADIHAGKMKMPTLEKPNFDINAPEFNTGKLKKPKFGLSGNLPKSPDFKGPKFKGGISGQDINLTLPESDLKTPNLDYNSPDIGMEGSAGQFKTPKFKTPKFSIPGFKGHKTDIKGDLKHPDLNLSSPGLDGEISPPDMNIDGPKFKSSKGGLTLPDVNLPSGNVKMPKLKTPNLGLSGPNVKAPEMDLAPGMIKGEINSPDFTGPDVNIDMPTGKIKGSTLKTPNVDMKAPGFDTDVPTGKFKMPKFGFSGNLPKGPNLKGPKIKGGIDNPKMDLNLSKPDFEGPNLNVKSPDMDIDGPSGKMKMPTFKIPTLGHPKVKTPEMDISAPTFKGDINSPDFNIKGHKPNFTAPELDTDIHAGKMKMPSLEKPNFDINAPEFNTGKLKKPKFGLSGNLPKSPDLKGPKFKGGISGKGVNMTLPESDLKTPNLDYNSPDIGMEGSAGNLKKPKFKTPKFSIPGVKGPKTDIKGDLKHPDFTLPSSNLDAEINTPDIDIDGPKAGLKGSKAGLTLPDIDLPSSKIRMPKGPMPNIKAPKVKGVSDVPDVNLKFPEANMRGPKLDVKSPDIDIDGPEGKLNMPRLKAPKIGLPGFKDPNVNPKLNAGLSGHDISFDGPKANLQGFKSDVNLPDMDLPSGKVNVPKFKMPDFGLSRPNIKVPEMNTSPPTMKGEINTDAALGKVRLPDSPDTNLQFPESHMKRPQLDVKSPETDVNGAGGKFKTPRLKTPKFDIPDFKEHDPEVKGNLFLSSPKFDPDIRAPEFDTRADLKGPKTNHTLADTDPSFSKLDIDSFEVPDLGLSDIKLPNMKGRGEFNSPGIKFTEPEFHDPDIDPSISTTRSKAESLKKKTNGSIKLTKDLDSLVSDLDLDVPHGTLKKSKFKLLTIV